MNESGAHLELVQTIEKLNEALWGPLCSMYQTHGDLVGRFLKDEFSRAVHSCCCS